MVGANKQKSNVQTFSIAMFSICRVVLASFVLCVAVSVSLYGSASCFLYKADAMIKDFVSCLVVIIKN